MIKIEQLKKQFGPLQVLKGLSFDIEEGGITAILGPNGSGKTTLIKSVLGLVIPDEGEISINDESIKHRWDYRKQIGYLPQIAKFPENLKVSELIKLLQDIRGEKGDPEPLVELFELESHLNKRLRYLSGGTRQKVNITLTFMFDCPLYILDEPTSGLDPVALIRLKDLINIRKNEGRTFLITTHIMNLVEELADRLLFLLEGKIYFDGTYNEMIKEQEETNLERSIAKILENANT